MSVKPEIKVQPQMSDEAVWSKTGKTWPEWFAVLDAAGAMELRHKEIVAFVKENHKISPWWQQMVAVTYEQARGLREKHEKPEGFQISRSKTVNVDLPTLYRAWSNESLRKRWLPEKNLTVRKATPNKSVRTTWTDGQSSVELQFYNKGTSKSQIVAQHSKLPDAESGKKMKAYWGERLETLKAMLEKSGGRREGK